MKYGGIVVTRTKAAFTQTIAPSPKTAREIKLRSRSMALADALIAAEWLNAVKGSAACARVLAVRQELVELRLMIDSLRRQRQEARARRKGRPEPMSEGEIKETVQRAELFTRFRDRHNALNRTLSRYVFVPILAYDLD